MKKISWRHGALAKGRANIGLPYRDIRDLVMQGVPNEEESDRCLAEIVRNKFNSDHRIPGLCLEILTTRESSKGYPLTHRLLIVQIAKIVSISSQNFCSSIRRIISIQKFEKLFFKRKLRIKKIIFLVLL